MSDATPRPTPPAHPTRQQLDELEALMQQMLALPVNQIDDDAVPSTVLLPTFEPEVSPPENAVIAAPAERQQAYWEATLPTAKETAPAPEFLDRGMPVTEAGPKPSWASPSSPQPAIVQRIRSDRPSFLRRQRKSKARWLLAPLVWTNLSFDRLAGRLGRPGRWLQGQRGRLVVGWLGILFLLGAITLGILEIMGWPR
jgi:hypothetical protein